MNFAPKHQEFATGKWPLLWMPLHNVTQGIVIICRCNTLWYILHGPRQANLILIADVSSEGTGEPAHPCSLTRTFAACAYKLWVKRNLQTESQIPGPSEWLGMRSWNLSWRNARRHKFAWRGSHTKHLYCTTMTMKLGSKNYLLDTPCLLFVKKYLFCIKLLHAHLQYVWKISSKCWKAPVKVLRGVDFTKYVLPAIIY